MMIGFESNITKKGNIKLPENIRDMLDVFPGEYVSVKVSDEPLANYGANNLTLESDDFEAAGVDPTANIEIVCADGQIIIREAEEDE